MLKFVKIPVAALALMVVGLVSPVAAQSASDMAVRMQMLEDQVRRLTGEVQELSFEVKQLRAQAGAGAAAGQSGAVQPMTPPAAQVAEQPGPSQQKRLAAASAGTPIPDSNDIEVIQQQPIGAPPQTGEADLAAPGLQVLGAMDNAAAQPDDGGFQGKVLVPPSQQEPGDDAFVQQQQAGANSIETVALDPGATGESPEALYERSNESLLRRQFAEAEAGFSDFLQKYPDHGLAGAAQYWLGETFYAQGDFRRAAASFLQGYKKYPKSRRAPDSLLKLGISLNRLGQSDQACAAYAAVSAEYPKAVDARKRAQAEAKRAGCAS
ncbi:MAG: tol-pal system protein YbgF [Aestuariivirga sp.]|nr:tol-pal system protein YbgF [Aestuariivirga sp.]